MAPHLAHQTKGQMVGPRDLGHPNIFLNIYTRFSLKLDTGV